MLYEDRTHTIGITTRGAGHYTNNTIVLLVPCEGIEPPSDPCKGPALPLDEQGKILGCLMGIEPILSRSQQEVQTTTL